MWEFQLGLLAPEFAMLIGACVILILDLYFPKPNRWSTYFLTQGTLLVAFLLNLQLLPESPWRLFSEMFIVDNLALVFKIFILIFASMIFMYSREYLWIRSHHQGEYFVLCLFSILGMMVLVSSMHFLSLYLGLEILIMPLYALIAKFKEQPNTIEAAMKYFILGAIASGLLLYGISLVYGILGSLDFYEIATALSRHSETPVALLFGLVFITAGVAFKLGAVPFHVWIPDVYQGSATCVTLFISVLPKLAATVMTFRVFQSAFLALSDHWQPLLLLLIVLSLVLGNLGALLQSNIKRLFGYSAIAHVGFLLMGFLGGPRMGGQAVIAYVLIYTFVIMAGFSLILLLSKLNFECDSIQDMHGLSERHPWIAFLMMIVLLSLAGIPPLIGFYAKFVILQVVVDAGYAWLAVFALFWSVIGAFYYLRIIKVMYFNAPLKEYFHAYKAGITDAGLVLASCHGVVILSLTIFPWAALRLARVAIGFQ